MQATIDDGSGEGKAGDPGAARVDTRRLLRAQKRRFEQLRAEQARSGERERRELFRHIEQVMRQVCDNARLMADVEIRMIIRRMISAPDLEGLNFELRLLAGRLGEMAGSPVRPSGPPMRGSASGREIVEGEQRPARGRLRLRL